MAQNLHAARWKDLKTGLLFLVGMIILGWLGFTINSNTGLFGKSHTLNFFSTNAVGLRKGNFVGIEGKKVGVVSAIDFDSTTESERLKIQIEIEDQYFHLIHSDAKVLIKGMGLLGDKEVVIDPGHQKNVITEGSTLVLGSEPGLEDLTANAASTLRNLDSLTAKILHGEGTLGKLITTTELNDKINQTLASLNNVEERITNGKGLVPQLLNNGELAQQVSQTTNDLRETMAKLKEGNGSLGKFLMGDEFLSRLNAVSAHTDSLLIQLGNPNGSLAKFTNDSTLYKNINGSALSAHRAISSLDSLLTDIKSNPKRYLHFSVF
jgi:phospholipid/cholesterol/gamma-HCH transport system substrate-binding protein